MVAKTASDLSLSRFVALFDLQRYRRTDVMSRYNELKCRKCSRGSFIIFLVKLELLNSFSETDLIRLWFLVQPQAYSRYV